MMDFFNSEHAGFIFWAWAVGVGVMAVITVSSLNRLRQARHKLAQIQQDSDGDNG